MSKNSRLFIIVLVIKDQKAWVSQLGWLMLFNTMLFLVHISSMWFYGIGRVCSSGRPASQLYRQLSCFVKTLKVGHYVQIFQPIFFFLHTYRTYRLHWLLLFDDFNHFHWSWSLLGVTRLVQSKTYFLFSHFATDQDEIWCGVEAVSILFRYVDLISLILILSHWMIIQGREP